MTHPTDVETDSFAEAFEASLNFKQPEQGDTIRGTIVSISGDNAYISYGGPTEAVIDAAEVEGLYEGDTVEATVIQTGSELRLSRKLIARRANLDTLRAARDNGIPVEGKVTARNKGGFDVSISGLRAFCPLSQIALGKIENPDGYVGTTQEFRVTELSDDGRKIVVSRAALLKEAAAARAEEIRSSLEPGAIFHGKVKSIVPFGAFVDLGGVEGLLHVSEMSRRRVNDPNEVVSIGQEVTVKVIKIDESGKRISLSMKDLEADPWDDVANRYTVGSPFSGRIVRSADFGLFVELEPGIDGLVHVSQLPIGVKLGDPSIAIGTVVSGWVREVDPERRRLSLALREIATEDPWEFADMKYPIGRVLEGTIERVAAPGIFVQIEPGLTGLVPAADLNIAPGSAPSKTFKEGDKLAVKIVSIDKERRRLSLSHADAKDEASHTEYLAYVNETKDEAAVGKSAMQLALERALKKE